MNQNKPTAKPYVHQPFPSCRYHSDGRCVIIQNPDEEQALGPGWEDSPAKHVSRETPAEVAPAVKRAKERR